MSDFKTGDRVRWGFEERIVVHVDGDDFWTACTGNEATAARITHHNLEYNATSTAPVVLVARAVYMTPERIAALEAAKEELGQYQVCEHYPALRAMLAEARGEVAHA